MQTDREERPPLTALVGPTAAGKTALALELCERLGAEVLSLDSMLVYRGLDVGTAKPSAAERERVPHHLIDLVDPPERYDVQRYLADAEAAEAAVVARGRLPLYVGGTGFYLMSLLSGLHEGPPMDAALRAELEGRWDADAGQALHAELAAADPSTAARVHPNDRKRVVRAHEIWRQSGQVPSASRREWSAPPRPHRLVGIGLDGAALRERIEARTRAMLAAGWIDEVRAILDGPGFGPTSAQALGYPEIRAHLAGELDREALAARIATKTWRFSRRQLTWYRRIEGIEWVDADVPNAIERAQGALDAGG
ncbi:MAG: tRNA (adenosine(37)-N6)-dimethylallyltransferase MiaA [Planctomycetota bacterium]